MEGGLIQEYFFHFKGNVAEPQWVHRNAVGALRHASGVQLARQWRDNGGETLPQIQKVAQISLSNHDSVNVAPTREVPRQTELRVPQNVDPPTHQPSTSIQPGPITKTVPGSTKPKPVISTTQPTTASHQTSAHKHRSFDFEQVAQAWKPPIMPQQRPLPPTLSEEEMERMRAVNSMQLHRLQSTIVSSYSFHISIQNTQFGQLTIRFLR